jgi:hypothetical protein
MRGGKKSKLTSGVFRDTLREPIQNFAHDKPFWEKSNNRRERKDNGYFVN